jgi:hypothetical protein
VAVFSLFAVMVWTTGVAAQVVQIESKRIRTDTTGWAGEVSAAVQLIHNTSDVLDIGTNLHLQYKTPRNLFLILNNLDFIRADGQNFENRGYQHFRYNYKVRDWFTWEAFVQAQYDRPLRLDFRGLVGTGPRVKVFMTKQARAYVASLVMIERENITGSPGIIRDVRVSNYVSFTIDPNPTLRLVSTTYYQPNIREPGDYRLASDSVFIAGITKKLAVFASFSLLHDTRPPLGVVSTSYTFKNGLVYGF